MFRYLTAQSIISDLPIYMFYPSLIKITFQTLLV